MVVHRNQAALLMRFKKTQRGCWKSFSVLSSAQSPAR
jgi:hypothetical protein